LSRQFVRHNVFELPETLSPARRKAALSLLVRKWAPFAMTGYLAQWAGRRASVYAWDSAKVGQQIMAAGLNPSRCVVLPESFIRTPHTHGPRLVKAVDGYEGQVWNDGFLVAGRWWPRPPALTEWRTFVRASGVAVDGVEGDAPESEDPAFMSAAWAGDETAITDIWSALQNKRIAAAAAVAAIAPVIFFGTQAMVFSATTASTNAAIADLESVNQALRVDRMDAYTQLEAIESMLTLEPFPPQYEIISRVMGLLDGRGAALKEWSYNTGVLEFTLLGSQPLDATFYITMFEKEDMFSGVTSTTAEQERELRMRMNITPRSAAAS